EQAAALFQLPRGGGETELVGATEMLEHSKPIAEARTVALINYDHVEEVGCEVLVDLLSLEVLVEVLVVCEVDLADEMFTAGHGILVDDYALARVKCGKRPVGLVLK